MPALDELDRTALARAVGRAVGRTDIELVDWRCRSIHDPFNQTTGGLYRLAGTGCDGGETIAWSMVVKVVRASMDPLGGSIHPLDANHWEREALIFQSGLLEELPGIRAPRCFGVDRCGDTLACIWLEDIADDAGPRWPPALYELAAHRLGEFNGAYLTGRPVPTSEHVSHNWLRAFVKTLAPAFARLPDLRDHPLIRRCWPGRLLDRVLGLWEDRDALLEAVEGLPHTFCHLDAFPRNLLIHPATRDVVAVDWSYAGIAPIGSELAPLVAASACFYDAEPEQLGRIEEISVDAYMAGLRAAGWRGDAETVRLGYAGAAALHYGLFPLGTFLVDDTLRARFERVLAHTASDIADRWAAVAAFLLDRADEARHLLQRA